MNILLACEESQTVCKAFRELGANAFSCDLQDCSGGHPEWHIKDDVLPLLNGHCAFETVDGSWHSILDKWDLIIAFPPCTHLAVSGAAWFERKRENGDQRFAIEFFSKFLYADCDHICIENPVNIIGGGDYLKKYFPDLCEKYDLPRKPSISIQPWQFGHMETKKTNLWLKGLPDLVPEILEKPDDIEYVEWKDKKTGKMKRMAKWYMEAWSLSPSERSKMRSKTFDGVGKAMAEQWFAYLNK